MSQPFAVVLRLSLESLSTKVNCDTSGTQSSTKWYVGHCSSSLSSAWFSTVVSRSASVSVTLRDSTNAIDLYTSLLDTLSVQRQPSWWDALLRSTTVGNGLKAPSGVSSSGGVFVTLPSSKPWPVSTGTLME